MWFNPLLFVTYLTKKEVEEEAFNVRCNAADSLLLMMRLHSCSIGYMTKTWFTSLIKDKITENKSIKLKLRFWKTSTSKIEETITEMCSEQQEETTTSDMLMFSMDQSLFVHPRLVLGNWKYEESPKRIEAWTNQKEKFLKTITVKAAISSKVIADEDIKQKALEELYTLALFSEQEQCKHIEYGSIFSGHKVKKNVTLKTNTLYKGSEDHFFCDIFVYSFDSI